MRYRLDGLVYSIPPSPFKPETHRKHRTSAGSILKPPMPRSRTCALRQSRAQATVASHTARGLAGPANTTLPVTNWLNTACK